MAKKKRRKARGAGKGGSFERKMCVELSEWWTGGERDDIFWRTAGSGNRATMRHRFRRRSQNRFTFGAVGDVGVVDPLGLPFLDVFTVSLKNGYHQCHASGLLDKPNQNVNYELELWLQDIKEKWESSGSLSWMIIHQRTSRARVIYIDHHMTFRLSRLTGSAGFWPVLHCAQRNGFHFDVVRYDTFIKKVTPEMVQQISKKN